MNLIQMIGAILLLLLVTLGCEGGGDGFLTGSTSVPGGPSQGVQNPALPSEDSLDSKEFLARSGFLGVASINDRALGQNRYLVFHARAPMIPRDLNGVDDVFMRDLRTGKTSLVSIHTNGTQGNGISSQASISANGRYVVFRSAATNLVAGDSNGVDDIFLRDLVKKTTVRVSLGNSGEQANGASSTPAVSEDGRYVVFASTASNLVPGDNNNRQDIFLRDRELNSTTLISRDSAGLDSDGPSFDPTITADGAFIAFSTEATDMIAGGLNGQRQIVRHQVPNGNRVLVSQSAGGVEGDRPSYEPSISDDGNRIAFFSLSSVLDPSDSNNFFDVFVRDVGANTTTVLSRTTGGNSPNGHSGFPSISGNGARVAYGSLAGDLVPGDTNGVFDVFTVPVTGGPSTRVSVTSAGAQANIDSDLPAMSQNGRYVAFRSAASNLVTSDATPDDDIFVRDLDTPTPTTFWGSISFAFPATWPGLASSPSPDYPTFFPAGPDPVSVELGDMNGDGYLDAVTANYQNGTNTVSVLLSQNGTGSFAAPISYATAGRPHMLALEDVNNDGYLDVVTADFLNDTVSVLINDGSGVLGQFSSLAVPGRPVRLALADMNDDGFLDIVTANNLILTDTVSVLLNNGQGGFGAPQSFPAGVSPRAIAIGDLNGDGFPDVVVTNSRSGTPYTASVLLNNGTGSLAAPVQYAVGDTPLTVALADTRNLGRLDIIVGNQESRSVSVLRNDGSGVFGAAQNTAIQRFVYELAVGDVDGDGWVDIVTANPGDSFSTSATLLRNSGSGTYPTTLRTYYPTGNVNTPLSVALGDIDGDGDLDVVHSNAGADTIGVRKNLANP